MSRGCPFRTLGWCVLAALSLSACHHWVPVSPDGVRAGQVNLNGDLVRVTNWTSGDEEFVVERVAYPLIEGHDLRRGRVQVDLTSANAVEVRRVRVGATIGTILGSIAATALLGWATLLVIYR